MMCIFYVKVYNRYMKYYCIDMYVAFIKNLWEIRIEMIILLRAIPWRCQRSGHLYIGLCILYRYTVYIGIGNIHYTYIFIYIYIYITFSYFVCVFSILQVSIISKYCIDYTIKNIHHSNKNYELFLLCSLLFVTQIHSKFGACSL